MNNMISYKDCMIFFVALILFTCAGSAYGGDQSSIDYKIPKDVLSGGGGNASSSGYKLRGTLGQPSGKMTSSANVLYAGFWHPNKGSDGEPSGTGTIVGSNFVCAGTNCYTPTYTVSGFSGAYTYYWEVTAGKIIEGQGGDTVTVEYTDQNAENATLRVTPKNDGGDGTPASLNIALDTEGVWPGDVDYDGYITQTDFNKFVALYERLKDPDMQPDNLERPEHCSGIPHYQWNCHYAPSWPMNTIKPDCPPILLSSFNGNLKHMDCNGDGKIDDTSSSTYFNNPVDPPDEDLHVIAYNIARNPLTHNKNSRGGKPAIHIHQTGETVISESEALYEYTVTIGNVEKPETNVTGVNFEIKLSEGTWQNVKFVYFDYSSFTPYKLGTPSLDMLTMEFVHPADNASILLAMQRRDFEGQTFAGDILCKFTSVFPVEGSKRRRDRRSSTVISITNAHVFSSEAGIISVKGGACTLNGDEVVNEDTDDDNLPDQWELENFGDLSRDGTGDHDNDGLSDLDEYENGTDPASVDTDEDGLPDAWELNYGLDPLSDDSSEDSDQDGHSNLQEYNAGTDPSDPDSYPEDPILSAGIFTAGQTGIVKAEWLYDGGAYKGELGIFNIRGMDMSVPDLTAFVEEAVRRVLSGVGGHIVLSDPVHRARFSGTLGGESTDWNEGELLGLREFDMEPGTRFALMLIPNSTFGKLAENPGTTDRNRRPLFSIASPNADYGMHTGQVADINGMGKAFAIEDMELTDNSIGSDYNDLVIQILGAESEVPSIDDMLAFTPASGKRSRRDSRSWFDWRTGTELGRKILAHVEATPGNDDLSVSVSTDAYADLMIYASDKSFSGKDGSEIPGSFVRLAEDGAQSVFLPKADGSADYRIVLRGLGNRPGSLTVRKHLGLAELSADTTEIRPEAHQVLTANISVSASDDSEAVISIGEIAVPTAEDGTPLCHDINGDNKIDEEDIEMVTSRWNSSEGTPEYNPYFDFDDDGFITILDIMAVVNSK